MMNLISNFVSTVTAPLYSLISAPTWFFAAPGKVAGLSAPKRVVIFSFLVIAGIVSLVVIIQRQSPSERPLWNTDPIVFYPLMFGLVVAVSVVLGFCYYFWFMEVASPYPEILRAWNRGIADLQANGIELADLPLFLIFGIPDASSANSLMQASGLKLGIKPPDDSLKPLLWFTGEKDDQAAIFLFLCTCCQTSMLSGSRGLEREHSGSPAGKNDVPMGTLNNVMNSYGFGDVNPSAQFSRSQKPRESESADQSSFGADDDSGPVLTAMTANVAKQVGQHRGGMHTVGSLDDEDRVPSSKTTAQIFKLESTSASTAKSQLEYVSRLLRVARQPYCPCNGMILTVPYRCLLAQDEMQGKNLGDATRADMETVTKELGLRSHVISLVHGLDTDDDFRVFVKRMREFQSPADVDRRLGKGLPNWADNGYEVIESVGYCSCDAFQKLIYKYFSTTQSLKKVDNGQLYRFLSRIRGRIAVNLSQWLAVGFVPREGADGRPTDPYALPVFAGCYFVAAQPQTIDTTDDDRLFAHVPGVFERVFELQGDIEWSPASIATNRTYLYAANLFFLATLAGVVTIVIGIFGILGVIDRP